MRFSALLCLALGTGALAGTTEAVKGPLNADPALFCEYAAQQAAAEEGVPLSVLNAISLNETGRKREGAFRPWPWTVNMEGAGHWFDTPEEALAYAEKEFARGARSFDVGCFQINYKWHGEHFASIDEMFDPMVNARYAARFLKTLYSEQGSWEAAAGAYHSRTPEYANRYAARFSRFRNDLIARYGEEIPEIPDIVLAAYGAEAEVPRVNNYPLLKAGSAGGLGSLVPIGNGARGALFGGPAPSAEAEVPTE
ncbi:transglycosylase SLT domain-containing protein [Frigidibacter sp. RF13]|nr:transglycosylase SLT domain-containing protein [Frigidibacter sp. RF13]